jgi:hypothetical protein
MRNHIIDMWEKQPLKLILLLAILMRLVASIFSKGYGMHDDHFLVLEPAQSWVDGYDYNSWLPGSSEKPTPSGHSFFYVSIHYLILWVMKFTGIFNPQTKMFIIRLLHAAFSLITVYIGYKITLKLSDQKTAKMTGLMLAVLWFMPFLSVRNLVEIVCIPFLIYATWLIIKNWDKEKGLKYFFYAGLVIGLGFSVRFQIITFAFGLGLAVMIKLRWKESLLYGSGFILSAIIVQGGVDYFVWGKPFMELREYIRYNIENASTYVTNSWYSYVLLILGALIPPVSIFLFIGFFRSWRKYLILFLPTFIFILFHSVFPNKQERFIFPIIPFIIILGMIGWREYLLNGKFLKPGRRFLKSSWIIFWTLNIILLLPFSVMYSKKSRVEAMVYLSHFDNVSRILVENSVGKYIPMIPIFYAGQYIYDYTASAEKPASSLPEIVKNNRGYQPRFFLFIEPGNIDQRVAEMKKVFPNLIYETTINPGMVDEILNWLNPRNDNQTIIIYRNRDFYP